MFTNSQVGLLSPEKLANSAVLSACLSQVPGSQARLWRIDWYGGERFERETLGRSNTSLVIAAIAGLPWLIATAFFAAGNC